MARATATVTFQALELKGSLLPASLLEEVSKFNRPKELWEDYGNLKDWAGASTAGLHFGLRLLREVFGWSGVEACHGWQQGESARTHTTQGATDRWDGFAGSPNRQAAAEWGHGHRHCSTD